MSPKVTSPETQAPPVPVPSANQGSASCIFVFQPALPAVTWVEITVELTAFEIEAN